MKIERVEISRLRGIPGGWPELKVGTKGLIIYGPNGVGKSSVIDALEATIAGRSTLFENERAGVNWEAAAPHLHGGPSAVTIKGKLNGKLLELSLGDQPDDDLKEWLAAAKNASFVLRRYMLLRFIDAQPKQRYEQIQPFLNLEDFNSFEAGLKEFALALESKISVAKCNVTAKEQIIRQTFGLSQDSIIDGHQLLARLQDHLTNSGFRVDEIDVSDAEKLVALIMQQLGGEEANKKLAAFGGGKHQAQVLSSISTIRPLYDQVLEAFDDLTKELSQSVQKAPVHLLEQTLAHVKAVEDLQFCPLCENPVEREELMARLEERIQEDCAVKLATGTLQSRLSILHQTTTSMRQVYAAFISGWDLLGFGPLPECYTAAIALMTRLEAVTLKNAGDEREALKARFLGAECNPNTEIATIDEAIASVGSGQRRTLLMESITFINVLKDVFPDFEKSRRAASLLEKQKPAADALRAHAEAARKEAVQNIANQVAAQANSLYEEIHPNEGISTSKLSVRSATTASMELKSTFYGREVPPLLYYSDSHLDTLGLCYFLAIRKMEARACPTFNLLLLDDVLHSVDAEHRAKLARVLKNNFDDYQIILVTHDKHFYDRLRAILGGGYQYVVISDWDINHGPRLGDPSTDLDRVIDVSKRDGKSHEEMSAAGGRFFEWLLKELTERLQIAIQARFTRQHDIGSMWPSLSKKMRTHRGFNQKHQVLLQDLDDSNWVRNKIGAHHNETESAITPKEVLAFVDQLALLYHATNCSDCHSAIQKSPTDDWRCDCSKLQYDCKASSPELVNN